MPPAPEGPHLRLRPFLPARRREHTQLAVLWVGKAWPRGGSGCWVVAEPGTLDSSVPALLFSALTLMIPPSTGPKGPSFLTRPSPQPHGLTADSSPPLPSVPMVSHTASPAPSRLPTLTHSPSTSRWGERAGRGASAACHSLRPGWRGGAGGAEAGREGGAQSRRRRSGNPRGCAGGPGRACREGRRPTGSTIRVVGTQSRVLAGRRERPLVAALTCASLRTRHRFASSLATSPGSRGKRPFQTFAFSFYWAVGFQTEF